MSLQEMHALFEYDVWATDRTLDTVSTLTETKYQEDLRSSHGGIHGTLLHIYAADMIWLQRWTGTSPSGFVTATQIPDLKSLSARWQAYRRDLEEFLRGLTEASLAAEVSYKDTRGNPHSEPLYQQMQHCINHSSYHRGQIVTMLRQCGGKPIGTDLIVFFRSKQGPAAMA